MSMVSIIPPDPIYHLGWIIQPMPEGYEVYQRLDTSKPHCYFFGTLREAFNYVNEVVQ